MSDLAILKNITKFFAELGMSRRRQRSGPLLAGVKYPENIAEHVFRAAQIAYVLAYMEGANTEVCAAIVLFHDNGEFRTGDQNKIASRYFNIDQAEADALTEHFDQLPTNLSKKLLNYYHQFEARDTKEGIVAKDADWLETAITAKEYSEQGYQGHQNWIDNIRQALETASAKKILDLIDEETDFTNSWWQGLKKMNYTKLPQK
jgi:putative hydrolase of HD superfamily